LEASTTPLRGIIFRTLHFHVSPWRTQTYAPNAMARTPLSNSNKATKAIGGIREEEQRKSTKNSKI
jgi:hypothetical protein